MSWKEMGNKNNNEEEWEWENKICQYGSNSKPHALAPRDWKSDYQKMMEKVIKVEKIDE